ncbi:protein kinase [bacterium]|nr:protein kinase [bacterium]
MADYPSSPDSDSVCGDGSTVSDTESEAVAAFEGNLVADGATIDMSCCKESSLDSSDDLRMPDRLADRYVVLEEIGHGGVGLIHRGWDTQLNREVAVKVLRKEFLSKPESLRRFMNEAIITSQLQHPGIVPVHEFGMTADRRPFILMRLISGETLDLILKRRTNVTEDLPSLMTTFYQVCQTIAYAHAQGIIHRDIKPANIMVGHFGVVKVMDWGLSKSLREPDGMNWPEIEAGTSLAIDCQEGSMASGSETNTHRTLLGTVFGTPGYLPPEQARGENGRVDERSDVFGLGGILCFILTGFPPYSGETCGEILRKAAAADLADAMGRLENCNVPADLLKLAKRCLAPEIEDRPANAAEVVEALTAHLQADQRRAERDLVRFFELSLDLFCIAGINGYFRRINENFTRLLGHSAEELTSRPFFDFVHPDDREVTRKILATISAGKPCIQFTNRYRHLNGEYLWLEWNARLVEEERAIYAVARDVTERVAREESLRNRAEARRVTDSSDKPGEMDKA